MKWILVIPVILMSLLSSFSGIQSVGCDCPAPTQLSRTGKSSGSISFSWNGPQDASSYEVWYVREEGAYTSPRYSTTSESFQFDGLATGQYTFYFSVICDGQPSSIIGWEDVIEN